MQPKITQVEWSATNIPSGLSFDAQTGTFSGTPTVSGTYTVPVHVETNYGEDTKDVLIKIEPQNEPEPIDDAEFGDVYAIGNNAETWSNNAEPDDYGFRKLPMPKAKRLVTLDGNELSWLCSWAAQTENGKWYGCVVPTEKWIGASLGIENFYPTTPQEIPLDDITEIAQGLYDNSDHIGYYCYLDSQDNCRIYINSHLEHIDTITIPNVKKLNAEASMFYMIIDGNGDRIDISVDGTINKSSIGWPESGVKTIYNDGSYPLKDWKILSNDGELYTATSLPTITKLNFPYGKIKEIYPCGWAGGILVLTEDNVLYGRGNNTDGEYVLGLPELKTYTKFTKVGNYNVKRIYARGYNSFMLLEDGTLWHTGSYSGNSTYGVTDNHQGFEQIFPELRFKDITYVNNTLIVIRDTNTEE